MFGFFGGLTVHPLSQDNLEAELHVVDAMPNIFYVQSVNRDYREALDSVFDVFVRQNI